MRTLTILLLTLGVGTAHAATIPIPAGLDPGDSYHILFVSSTTRDATSSDIADYNDFVQAAADAAFGAGHGVSWFAVGSTPSVDAKDNAVVSAPVYNMNGDLVATGFTDFWDGSLSSAPSYDENAASNVTSPFTGTAFAGAATSAPLGAAGGKSTTGSSGSTSSSWTDTGTDITQSSTRSFYALSGELTVVPKPSTALLLGAGLAVLAARRRMPDA